MLGFLLFFSLKNIFVAASLYMHSWFIYSIFHFFFHLLLVHALKIAMLGDHYVTGFNRMDDPEALFLLATQCQQACSLPEPALAALLGDITRALDSATVAGVEPMRPSGGGE